MEQAIQQMLTDAGLRILTVVLLPVVLIGLRGIVGARAYKTPAMRRVTRQTHIYNK